MSTLAAGELGDQQVATGFQQNIGSVCPQVCPQRPAPGQGADAPMRAQEDARIATHKPGATVAPCPPHTHTHT
eukprot:354364-Chlamydomonas_euryale.AAC.2